MRMKHIAAENMQAAMEFAREELGEDAVLLASENAKDGSIIVTFAIDEDDIDAQIAQALAEPMAAPSPDELPLDIEEKPSFNSPKPDYYPVPSAHQEPAPRHPLFSRDHPALNIIQQVFMRHPLPERLNREVQSFINTHELDESQPLEAAERMLSAALSAQCQFAPINVADGIPEKALMLVGAHGAGKTTAIAKLATAYAIKKIPMVLISTDTHRLGGSAELQSVADILGGDLLQAENRTQLRNLVKSKKGKAAILVDSAGVNIYDFAELKALGEFASLDDIEPILTMQAGIAPQESEEMASVFSFLDISRAIITRMDTTRHFSSLFHLLHSSHYALANYTHSQSPAEALKPCSGEALAHYLLTHHRETMAH